MADAKTQVVPVEPTEAMMEAFCEAHRREWDAVASSGYRPGPGDLAQPCYAAMLAAAPQPAASDVPHDGDSICHECHRSNVVWFAPNAIWNTVMGGEGGVLCPTCFITKAEAAGVKTAAWRVAPKDADVTHDGVRDWSEDATSENGNYQNQCGDCGHVFIGHKRRVVCKDCATPAPSTATARSPASDIAASLGRRVASPASAEEALREENARLREALEWYASLPSEWTIKTANGLTYGDLQLLGERARTALSALSR